MMALLIVDMQVGCFTGEAPRHDAEAVVNRINALAVAVRPNGLVVYIQHTDPAEGLERGSAAWQILPSLRVAASDERMEKTACDSFLETRLEARLRARGVDEVVITGCATDFCVDTTVRSAASLGFRVTAVSDAHTTGDRPHLGAVAIIAHHNYVWADLLLPRGRKVRVVPTAQLLSELRKA
jgi:nicotinamidase-related amidase